MVCQHGRLQAVCYDCRKNDKFTFAIRAQLEAAQAKLNTQKAYYESVFEDGAKQIKKCKDELAALKQAQGEPVCWLTPCGQGWMLRYEPPVNDTPLGWKALYERPANLAELKAAEWEKAANIALNLRHTDIDEETLDWCNGTLACEAALRAEAEKIRKGEWNDRQRTA